MAMTHERAGSKDETRTDTKRYYNLSYVRYSPYESTEPGKYMAEIPELPGCRAWGDTPDEAIDILESLAPAFIELRMERGDCDNLFGVFQKGVVAPPINSNLMVSV